ncbi:hypothetical protein [Scandinavium hiltneri]|uniref:hypothetical protein n=1 Tax=Scandinavium hiltneri TaxID=2926519 RepID=UPI0035B1EDD6
MNKKQQKKVAVKKPVDVQEVAVTGNPVPLAFGTEEMLGELEAIVADAEIRLAQELDQA